MAKGPHNPMQVCYPACAPSSDGSHPITSYVIEKDKFGVRWSPVTDTGNTDVTYRVTGVDEEKYIIIVGVLMQCFAWCLSALHHARKTYNIILWVTRSALRNKMPHIHVVKMQRLVYELNTKINIT